MPAVRRLRKNQDLTDLGACFGFGKEFLAFSPLFARAALRKRGYCFSLPYAIRAFCFFNKRAIARHVERRVGLKDYLAGISFPLPKGYGEKKADELLVGFDYATCLDLELTCYVLTRCVGDLFIPKRKPSFAKRQFDAILLFRQDEVFI